MDNHLLITITYLVQWHQHYHLPLPTELNEYSVISYLSHVSQHQRTNLHGVPWVLEQVVPQVEWQLLDLLKYQLGAFNWVKCIFPFVVHEVHSAGTLIPIFLVKGYEPTTPPMPNWVLSEYIWYPLVTQVSDINGSVVIVGQLYSDVCLVMRYDPKDLYGI